MRTAIVSDIHGNLTAFEAVIADIGEVAPDLVLHGGDLADNGSRPCDVIDRIRDLGWPGVVGNTDEMLFAPESLAAFAANLPNLSAMFAAIEEMVVVSRGLLGADRLAWLKTLPAAYATESLALVHASPASCWQSPSVQSPDEDFHWTYLPLAKPLAVFGHIHVPFVKQLPGITVANSGSVGMPYDGDQRASYLVVDGSHVSIRRVAYDVDRELRELRSSGRPHAEWVARMLESASSQPLTAVVRS